MFVKINHAQWRIVERLAWLGRRTIQPAGQFYTSYAVFTVSDVLFDYSIKQKRPLARPFACLQGIYTSTNKVSIANS